MSQQQSVAANDIQERLAAARREAEILKEKIRAKKEALADASRKTSIASSGQPTEPRGDLRDKS
jgi:guanine nucleotide-binding protein G(I)/G(S)/G(T) subunit beta-1